MVDREGGLGDISFERSFNSLNDHFLFLTANRLASGIWIATNGS